MAWTAIAAAGVSAYAAKQKIDAAEKSGGGALGMGSNGIATDGRTAEAVFDNSGWNVSFGSSRIDSTATKTVDQDGASVPNSLSPSPFAGFGQSLGQATGLTETQMVYAAVAVGLVLVWKRKKSA